MSSELPRMQVDAYSYMLSCNVFLALAADAMAQNVVFQVIISGNLLYLLLFCSGEIPGSPISYGSKLSFVPSITIPFPMTFSSRLILDSVKVVMTYSKQ
jgi:hypothetical protein